ncbi:type I methionyl aminopeptidase [Parenemella sanctibonifatiensis]|uniref:Methionine aminopeptidase n=1 Tax=Parenemella sanctibonifatiensis TaxID=2016505 RepID=A0A255EBX6_9ACTN|nr:type I methionyl aminopeptidase [Parenemella sanctibonifatiensis]OYN89068.1 type I methionyl aminopeptidase [Parenemella sanctibonifatiensis]
MFGRGVEIKTPDQVKLMRKAGLVVARALKATVAEVRPGISTGELDEIAAGVIASAGATPSFLNYGAEYGTPFPGVTCISVNEQVVHGIPGEQVLAAGDIVSIDCGAIVEGWHGDSAVTVTVGDPSPADHALSEATRQGMWAGIAAAKLGGRVTDISAAVEASVRADSPQWGIVSDFVGHGIGSAMHQVPDVPNQGRPGRGPKIVEGLCLAVEPIVVAGDPANATLDDDWTIVTIDGSRAAHWEHTMTVTKHGTWVLTAEDGGEAELTAAGVPFGPLAD